MMPLCRSVEVWVWVIEHEESVSRSEALHRQTQVERMIQPVFLQVCLLPSADRLSSQGKHGNLRVELRVLRM